MKYMKGHITIFVICSMIAIYYLGIGHINKQKYVIEEYYPLEEGYKFKPMYLPDYVNYSEQVILRYKNRVLLLCTYGTRSSDILIYDLSDKQIQEIFRLEDGDDKYVKILDLIDKSDRKTLINFITSVEPNGKEKVVLKMPLCIGEKWGSREVIDPEMDENINNLPDYIQRDISLTDTEFVVIKDCSKYFVYRRGRGMVLFYDSLLEYKE